MTDETYHLPARRVLRTVECQFESMSFRLTLDLSENGKVGEITVSGFKHGTALDLILTDACTLISELLRRYVSPETLRELAVLHPNGNPASIIGAILFEMCEAVQNGGGEDA